MDLELAGKVVAVTGASKGIGLAITRAFVNEGARVVAGARSSSSDLDALAASGNVEIVQVDLADPEAPTRFIAAAGDRLDILINNVGLAVPRTEGFLAITDDMWLASMNLNLMAAVRTTRAALPIMIAAGGGIIVNTGSVNARLPDPTVIDYSAAKAAMTNLAKSLSKEFGGRGIRVNTVAPGPVATDLWLGTDGVAARIGKSSGQRPEDIAAAAAQGMVTGRFSRPDEVADLVLLLASARSGNVTGAEFTIDGGLIATL
jgi:NAD(P)-dependent dehydrogenase (short-subunit alcohol dehydrogenase family)